MQYTPFPLGFLTESCIKYSDKTEKIKLFFSFYFKNAIRMLYYGIRFFYEMQKQNDRTTMSVIALIDYNMGNLSSVRKALEAAGADQVRLVTSPAETDGADALVLPGVGSFGDAMQNLTRNGWCEFLRDWIRMDRPFLGICLGMQMLLEESEETPGVPGLGIFKGKVRRFPADAGAKVPHMGWNTVRPAKATPYFPDGDTFFYFVHSYFIEPEDPTLTAAETDYIRPFSCAISRGRLLATQFHPEKSQTAGLELLKRFVKNISAEKEKYV